MRLPRFEDIPNDLNQGVHDFCVVLFGYEDPIKKPRHCGTGTLVKFRDNHYILTAGHCAKELSKFDKIAIPVRKGSSHPLFIQSVPPVYVGERREDAWGPDLAFIPMAAVDVRNLNAISHDKIFYNLGRHRSEILDSRLRIADNIWALVGSPYKLSETNESEKLMRLQLMGYKARVKRPIRKDEFDYLEICVPLDSENALPTFQGLSGGSLWCAELKRGLDGSLMLNAPHKLVGCAFYETEAKRKYRYIRCHGWRSIYDKGLSLLV